jgi:hypothetical protein
MYLMQTLSVVEVVVLGEVKRSRASGEFADEDLGQVYTTAARLLQAMPTRERVIVFLTDTVHIQFFQLDRTVLTDTNFNVWKTNMLALQGTSPVGVAALCWLLQADAEKVRLFFASMCVSVIIYSIQDLHFVSIDNAYPDTGVVVSCLGGGASGAVYGLSPAAGGDANYTLKVFTKPARADHEAAMLRKLQAVHSPLFPTLARHTTGAGQIAMQPVAERFQPGRFLRCHAFALVDAVEAMHKAGVRHRDIWPANIMRRGGSVLLIDFAYATMHRSAEIYEGTVRFAGDAVLQHLECGQTSFKFKCADDWASVARALYVFAHPVAEHHLVHHFTNEDYARLRQFWGECLVGVWGEMKDAASIRAHIPELFPPDCVQGTAVRSPF